MEPKEKKEKQKKPSKPELTDLAEYYLQLIEKAPGSLSLDKVNETVKEAKRQVDHGLRDGRSFDEIQDLQEVHKMVLEELKKHPELKNDSHRAFEIITRAIINRFDGPWGKLI